MSKNVSDFDIQRQVLQTAKSVAKEQGLIWEIALSNTGSEVLTGSKLERKEMVYSPIKLEIDTAIASGYFDTTAKDVVVISGAKELQVWDLLIFQSANKTSKGSLTVIVDSITDDTTFKAKKVWGTDIAIASWDLVYLSSSALEEWSTNSEYRGITKPRNVYNYPQIFRVAGSVSGSMASTNNWDFKNIKAELIKQVTLDLARKLNGIATSSIRYTTTTSDGKLKNYAWGLPFFVSNLFNEDGDMVAGTAPNVKNVGGVISLDDINDGFQYAIENGGNLNAIICSPDQARKISTFENAKINIQLVNGAGSVPTKVWGAVQVLESPIKVGKNRIEAIYVDTNMAKDEAYLFNSQNGRLIPKKDRGIVWFKIQQPDENNDNYRVGAICEWTFYYENALENTFKLEWLSL